jgi:hypothetical protein
MKALVRHTRVHGFLLLSVLPVLLLARDATAGTYGACVALEPSPYPSYWDPDLAAGYAKLNQPTNDTPTLQQLCTEEVFESLMQLHCSCTANPQPVQWAVLSYNSQGFCAFISGGDTCTYTCAANNCAFHDCAGVPTVSCPASILHLIDTARALNASGALNDGQANALISKLQSAMAALQNGNTTPARNKLKAFINQVTTLVADGVLSAADGQALVDEANAILAGL